MIPAGPFRFFSKIREDIRSSRCTTGISDTGGKLTTGVVVTGGKFTPGVINICGHTFREIYIDRGDTSDIFATGVKDTLWSTHSNR
jgi:hypothetical protein